MELINYIETIGAIMPKSLKALNELEFDEVKYDFVTGDEEYPKTMKDAFKKFKKLWRRKQ